MKTTKVRQSLPCGCVLLRQFAGEQEYCSTIIGHHHECTVHMLYDQWARVKTTKVLLDLPGIEYVLGRMTPWPWYVLANVVGSDRGKICECAHRDDANGIFTLRNIAFDLINEIRRLRGICESNDYTRCQAERHPKNCRCWDDT